MRLMGTELFKRRQEDNIEKRQASEYICPPVSARC